MTSRVNSEHIRSQILADVPNIRGFQQRKSRRDSLGPPAPTAQLIRPERPIGDNCMFLRRWSTSCHPQPSGNASRRRLHHLWCRQLVPHLPQHPFNAYVAIAFNTVFAFTPSIVAFVAIGVGNLYDVTSAASHGPSPHATPSVTSHGPLSTWNASRSMILKPATPATYPATYWSPFNNGGTLICNSHDLCGHSNSQAAWILHPQPWIVVQKGLVRVPYLSPGHYQRDDKVWLLSEVSRCGNSPMGSRPHRRLTCRGTYTKLKDHLLRIFSISGREKASRVLDYPALGNMPATKMVDDILHWLGEDGSRIMVKELLFRRPPENVRIILENNTTSDLRTLANKADKLHLSVPSPVAVATLPLIECPLYWAVGTESEDLSFPSPVQAERPEMSTIMSFSCSKIWSCATVAAASPGAVKTFTYLSSGNLPSTLQLTFSQPTHLRDQPAFTTGMSSRPTNTSSRLANTPPRLTLVFATDTCLCDRPVFATAYTTNPSSRPTNTSSRLTNASWQPISPPTRQTHLRDRPICLCILPTRPGNQPVFETNQLSRPACLRYQPTHLHDQLTRLRNRQTRLHDRPTCLNDSPTHLHQDFVLRQDSSTALGGGHVVT